MKQPIMKSSKKMLDCMKAISCGPNKTPVIMEVVGEDGIKVAEYVDKGKDKLPYYPLHERHSL